MYKIATPVWKREPVASPKPFVHPFYQTMFGKVYGLEEEQARAYIGESGAVSGSCDFVVPLVREVWEGHKNFASRFYDIRISEEAGGPAPEYAILKKAGIRDISPVSIRGMGSMAWLMGLQIMELETRGDNCAIMLLAELEHGFGAGEENTACAFALYPCEKIDDSKGIWITDYRMHLTVGEARAAVKNYRGRIFYPKEAQGAVPADSGCIPYAGHGLTAPLRYLFETAKKAQSADVMAVYKSGDRYGLVCCRVSGGEGER